ncbi:MAG: hypothetical protein ACLQDY_03745 [Streptosporangiaceae bacterium]
MSGYRDRAVAALIAAARDDGDFAGWLAGVLADVAGQLGGSGELTAGRPGSWEADLVDQLVKGTVGCHDEYLPGPRRGKLADTTARQIRDAADWSELTRAQIAAQFGVSASTVSAIATSRAHRHLDGAR